MSAYLCVCEPEAARGVPGSPESADSLAAGPRKPPGRHVERGTEGSRSVEGRGLPHLPGDEAHRAAPR